MTAYCDSSVILRVLFGEPRRLAEWAAIPAFTTSTLTRVECARTLDRVRLAGLVDPDAASLRMSAVQRLLGGTQTIELSSELLARAAAPLPVPLGTLDAIHLSSALQWRDGHPDDEFVVATHDRALGRAARIMGLTVIGTD